MKIKILTTGGTIDKIYFDRKSEFQVGDPQIAEVLKEANVVLDYEIEQLMRKDSLDMTEEDRQLIREAVVRDKVHRHFVITHGTDTMIETARLLQGIPDKVIVLSGAMQPARFRLTDAVFNIGCAIMAVQTLPEGVYIAMNGRVFRPEQTVKNVKLNRFEELSVPPSLQFEGGQH
ncbi:MAG: asparaginase domain-containing protein [bacterium]|nr:asparaginase domain-containing protein [candidate division KSB1 bacterium]MDH7559799.1 asparaginase domain-containing protein [bacterium]